MKKDDSENVDNVEINIVEKDNLKVSFESFDEIRKRNEEIKKQITAWNKGIYGEPYHPDVKEEMNLNTPDATWRGKGSSY